jgi:hypothetical protein
MSESAPCEPDKFKKYTKCQVNGVNVKEICVK